MDFKTFFISHCWEELKLKNHSSTSAQGFNLFSSKEVINLTDLWSYLFPEEG